MTSPAAPGEGPGEGLGGLSFEQLMDDLEATVARMAAGDLGIEEVTDLYERAGRLHAAAAARLAAVEARIARLSGPPAAAGLGHGDFGHETDV